MDTSKRYVLAIAPYIPGAALSCEDTGMKQPRQRCSQVSTDTGKLLATIVSTAEFRDEIWTKHHAHFPGIAGQFNHLISLETIERILTYSSPESNRIQVANEGIYADNTELRDPSTRSFTGRPQRFDVRKIELLLRKGSTLIINGIDEIHEPIGTVANDFEQMMGIPVQVNLYASWGTSPGFNVHWDEHEVLALQIRGRKQWRLYGATTLFPVRSLSNIPKPTADFASPLLLDDGDVLYVPRGHWHSVHPQNELSIHLTMGIHTRTGLDLLLAARERLALNSFARCDIPQFGHLAAQLDKYIQDLGSTVKESIGPDLLSSFIAERQKAIKTRRYINLGQVQCMLSRSLEPTTDIRFTVAMNILSIHECGDFAVLSDGTRRLVLSKAALPALNSIADLGSCSFGALCHKLLPDITADEVRCAVLEFCEAGLVTLH